MSVLTTSLPASNPVKSESQWVALYRGGAVCSFSRDRRTKADHPRFATSAMTSSKFARTKLGNISNRCIRSLSMGNKSASVL